MATMSGPRPWWTPAAWVALPATAFVVARLPTADASYPLGSSGFQYAPHLDRLAVSIATKRLLEGAMNPLEWLRLADGDFPPLVPVVPWVLAAPFGQRMEAAMLAGWFWVLLLAWGSAQVAGELSGEGPGSRGRTLAMGTTAAVLVAMGPLQAFSLRQYYDLPMLALFFVALALLLKARVWRAGAIAGAVAVAACLAKWTALPLLLITGAGVLLRALTGPPDALRGRLEASGAAVGVLAVALGLWFLIVPVDHDPGSYAAMAGTFDPDPLSEPVPGWAAMLLPESLQRGAERTNWLHKHLGTVWHAFHMRWMVWSMLSPLVVLLMTPLWLRWVFVPCRGGTVLLTTFVGHWLLLYFLVPVQDERFFLTGMVCVVIAAALGAAALPGRWAAGVGAAWVFSVLGIGADFHFGTGGPPQDVDGPLASWSEPNGWRLRSAYHPDLAWARGDEPRWHAPRLREAMLEHVDACDPRWVALGDYDTERRQAPILGEWRWWTMVFAAETLDDPDARRLVTRADADPETERPFGEERDRRFADLYFAPWSPGDAVRPPPGRHADELVLRGTIEPQDVDWEEGASVWLPPGGHCPGG